MARAAVSGSRRQEVARSNVVNLAVVRREKRVAAYRIRINEVIATNRETLGNLFRSGMIFHRLGLKAGRGLLRSHENLLRIRSLLAHAELLVTRGRDEADPLLAELDSLLSETNRLTERTRATIANIHADV